MHVSSVLARVKTDPQFASNLKADPVGTLQTFAQVPDTTVYWIVVISVGVMGGACVAGIIALAILGKTVPDALVAIASAMGGGLVGVLTPTQAGMKAPAQ
jgi:hypothetical protein